MEEKTEIPAWKVYENKRYEKRRGIKSLEMFGKGTSISPSTKNLYLGRIKRIWKMIEPENPFKTVNFVFQNTNKIIKLIDELDAPITSKSGLLSALNSLYHKDSYGSHSSGKRKIYTKMKI